MTDVLFSGSDKLAWSDGGEDVSYFQLRERVETFKRSAVFSKNAVAILYAEANISFVVRFLALLELGVPQAVLAKEISCATTNSETSESTGEREYLYPLGDAFSISEDGEVVWLHREKPGGSHSRLNGDTVLVLYTSGSSGKPKGVQLSRKNIESSISAIIQSLSFSRASFQWLQLNLHYSFGLLGQLLPALRCGVHTRWSDNLLVLVQQLSISEETGGMISGVPSQFLTLCQLLMQKKCTVPSISHVVLAGAHATLSLRNTLQAVFPKAVIYLNYGQTEASPRILCLPSDDPQYMSSATGYPVGNMRVRLSEEGELLVAGDQLMIGYIGDDKSPILDGWLHTGDIAEISDDGLVTISGRLDSVVKIAGEKVALVEVETVLNAMSGVQSAVVDAIDDERYGKKIIALLVFSDSSFSRVNIIQSLSAQLAPHKIPTEFYSAENIPVNANGKCDRKQLSSYFVRENRLS